MSLLALSEAVLERNTPRNRDATSTKKVCNKQGGNLLHFVARDVRLKVSEMSDLDVMPEDVKFLSKILWKVDPDRVSELLDKYQSVWLEAMQKEQSSIKKQNKGRFAANVWIRELISR